MEGRVSLTFAPPFMALDEPELGEESELEGAYVAIAHVFCYTRSIWNVQIVNEV